MHRRMSKLVTFLSAALFLAVLPGVAQAPHAQTFVYSDAGGYHSTYVWALNDHRQVSGNIGLATYSPGFLFEHNQFTTFVYKQPTSGDETTYGFSINNLGQIVGCYSDGGTHGFLRRTKGEMVTIPGPPGTTSCAQAINDFGWIVGWFYDDKGNQEAYVRSPKGHYTTFKFPGPSVIRTIPVAINNWGVVVGTYFDQQNRGFIYWNGWIASFECAPGAGTDVWSLNNRFQIVGTCTVPTTTGFERYNFLRQPDGATSRIDIHLPSAFVHAINDRGDLAGTFQKAVPQGSVAAGFLIRNAVRTGWPDHQ